MIETGFEVGGLQISSLIDVLVQEPDINADNTDRKNEKIEL